MPTPNRDPNVSGKLFLTRRALTDFESGQRTMTPDEAKQLSRQLKEIGVQALRMEHLLMRLDWLAQSGKAIELERLVTTEVSKPGSNVERFAYPEVPFGAES